MKTTPVRRKAADKTRRAILKSARKLFAANGFSATSTQSIAKLAKTNEALIFHHFGNKAKLWQAVKANIVECMTLEPLEPNPRSLRTFLQNAITQRLSAYQQDPELARLIQWQALELNQTRLQAGNVLAPQHWAVPLQHLQQIGAIKASISIEMIIAWLTASINLVILDPTKIFKDTKQQDIFIEHIINGFEASFS